PGGAFLSGRTGWAARPNSPRERQYRQKESASLPRRSVRHLIHDAGMKLFTERGFHASSVQDITEAAAVPKGSFYNHFKSKEALAAEILTAYGEGSTDRSLLTNSDVPGRVRIERHFAALNEYFSRCTDGCLV